MTPHDKAASDAAKYGRCVYYRDESGEYHQVPENDRTPSYIGHGTSVESALDILVNGHINQREGKYGRGVYGFGFKRGYENEVMMPEFLWNRTTSVGYNRGALFVFKFDGIGTNVKTPAFLTLCIRTLTLPYLTIPYHTLPHPT